MSPGQSETWPEILGKFCYGDVALPTNLSTFQFLQKHFPLVEASGPQIRTETPPAGMQPLSMQLGADDQELAHLESPVTACFRTRK